MKPQKKKAWMPPTRSSANSGSSPTWKTAATSWSPVSAAPVRLQTAITAAIALERGIEAAFQLEDSELSCEGLPDDDGRGPDTVHRERRRRCRRPPPPRRRPQGAEQGRPDRPGGHALRPGHRRGPEQRPAGPGTLRAGCYECLLSYSNQPGHEMIDRHLIAELLLRLADRDDRTPRSRRQRPIIPNGRCRLPTLT